MNKTAFKTYIGWFAAIAVVGLLVFANNHFRVKAEEREVLQIRAESAARRAATDAYIHGLREAREKEYDDKVKGWLEAQRKGQEGWEFWDDAGKGWFGITLYGLSSYEIVDASKHGEQVVRVHHTTKGGTPIVSILTISVSANKGIYNIKRQGGW